MASDSVCEGQRELLPHHEICVSATMLRPPEDGTQLAVRFVANYDDIILVIDDNSEHTIDFSCGYILVGK